MMVIDDDDDDDDDDGDGKAGTSTNWPELLRQKASMRTSVGQ